MIDAAQNIRNLKQAHADKKPRTRYINHKSEKRVIEEKEYLKKRGAFLKKHPNCEFLNGLGCQKKSVDIHHAKGRVGNNFLDETTWKAFCREHHTWCEMNPKLAKKLNMSNSRLKKA